ncbi:MAG TPA: hypothetical protein VNB06_19300 [Thermoanaerobaculia bacterium]|nr:hypothetical protein [Thermoanaerobaculia bacterium]
MANREPVWPGAGCPNAAWRPTFPSTTIVSPPGSPLPGAPGIELAGCLEPTSAPGLPPGTRALSLFVVNRQAPGEKDPQGRGVPLPGPTRALLRGGVRGEARSSRGGSGDDWDERVADLQYRDRHEYAVGHGTSVEAPEAHEGKVTSVRTTWLAHAEVLPVRAGVAAGVEGPPKALSPPDPAASGKSRLMLAV